MAQETGAKITVTDDVTAPVDGCDARMTHGWVSMGEPDEGRGERIALLSPYQVNAAAMRHGQPDVKLMHCLPAFHNSDTQVGREIFDKFGRRRWRCRRGVRVACLAGVRRREPAP